MNALHLLAKYGHTHVIDVIKTRGNDKTWAIASEKTGFNALHVATQFGQVKNIVGNATVHRRYFEYILKL